MKIRELMKTVSQRYFKWSPDINYRVGMATSPFYMEFDEESFYLCFKSSRILEIKRGECDNSVDPPVHVLVAKLEKAAKDSFGIQVSFDLGDLRIFEKCH
jgi:hypothetical protein